MGNPRIVVADIPVTVYRSLRIDCGLSPKTAEASVKGLKNSLYTVMLQDEGVVIGMGRIIGDGGCFCQVVDICVLPAYRGQGLGKMIMQALTGFIQEQLPSSCYISLIADGEASRLYEQFGFKDTLPRSRGMYLLKR